MTIQDTHAEEGAHHDVSGNTIFGFWVYLMTDFILFATLFAAYAVLRNQTTRELFDLRFALAETLVLLGSSFTCAMAMVAAHREQKIKTIAWFGSTFVLGFAFLTMVGSELASLVKAGHSWQESGFLSAYFTLAATHWLHIAFGLLFILVFVGQIWSRGFDETVMRRLTCLSLFWFFSYLVWIFMFTFVYLMGVV